MRNPWFGWVLASLWVCCSGCVMWDDCYGSDCHDRPGDISFTWSFALPDNSATADCANAGVQSIYIALYGPNGRLEFLTEPAVPCSDVGATLTDFWPERYRLILEGRCANGVVSHEATFNLDVYPGYNDFGILELPYRRPCQ